MLTLMLPNRTEVFDHAMAKREGWDVFDCGPDPDGKPERQLQRIDAPEDGKAPFPDDRDVWTFVVTRARAGSALHRAALAAVDDTELDARIMSAPSDPRRGWGHCNPLSRSMQHAVRRAQPRGASA